MTALMKILAPMLLILAATAAALTAQTTPAPPPFTITISAPQTSIQVGADVLIHAVFTNVSTQESNLLTMFSAECDYTIEVQDKNGIHTHEPNCSGSAQFTHLKPGKQLAYDDANLTTLLHYDAKQGSMAKVFDFTSPGQYVIQLSRYVDDDPNKEIVKSNKITITVTQ